MFIKSVCGKHNSYNTMFLSLLLLMVCHDMLFFVGDLSLARFYKK